MKSKSSFPLGVEKNGVTVLVYKHRPKSGYLSYVMTHHIGEWSFEVRAKLLRALWEGLFERLEVAFAA